MLLRRIGLCLALAIGSAFADGPADNIPAKVRRVPPLGIEVPQQDRADLQKRLDALAAIMVDVRDHALIMIYPNPLNPERYVVLNSGFTYREYDYLNNARQVPKLPDWAVIDLSEPPGTQRPGKVAAAGFFDEGWGLPRK